MNPTITGLVVTLVVVALLTIALLVLLPANLYFIPAVFATTVSGLAVGLAFGPTEVK